MKSLKSYLSQRIWKIFVFILKKKYQNPQEYRVKWGENREKFFSLLGPINCPSKEVKRLEALRNQYRNQRIFIVGNGPSLNNTDIEKLNSECSFGVNRIYLLFERTQWRPTFYTITDWRVAPDIANEVNNLSGMTFFFPERFRGLLRNGDDVYWYWKHNEMAPNREVPIKKRFAYNVHTGIRSGGSVLVTAIQLAFHLGFDPIYLVGVDLDYHVPNSVKQSGPLVDGVGLHLESTKDDDENHFDPRYFGKNRRWRAPNILEMIKGFENCKDALEYENRHIYNATVGGQLNVFERVNFEDLF